MLERLSLSDAQGKEHEATPIGCSLDIASHDFREGSSTVASDTYTSRLPAHQFHRTMNKLLDAKPREFLSVH